MNYKFYFDYLYLVSTTYYLNHVEANYNTKINKSFFYTSILYLNIFIHTKFIVETFIKNSIYFR